MKLSSFYFFAVSVLLLAASCQTDELANSSIVSGEAEFAIPLGKSTTTVEELLDGFDENTVVEIGADNIIHLIYTGDVLTQYAAEYLQDAALSIPKYIPIVDSNHMVLPFSSPEVLEVDKAIYKTGTVSVGVQSTDYVGPVKLQVSLPQVFKNGVPFVIETTFQSPLTGPIAGFGQELPNTAVDMAGYELIPENGQIEVEYLAITDNGAGDTILLDVVALISVDIYFSYFEGYLGNEVFNGGRDTIQIDFFENWTQGDVFFEDPVITINIVNSFGVPTRSVIDTFDILTADQQRIPLRSEYISTVNGIDFPYPLIEGDSATLTFDFDKSNSNIDTVLSSRPIALDYKVDARMNPDTNATLRGFISEESFYKIQVEVDLPLHGRASGFGVTDEFNIDLSGYGDVLEAEFKVVAENETPLDIVGQAYFLDGTGAILDSLFDAGASTIVGAALVDLDGNVISPTTEISFATFDAARFDSVRVAEKIFIEAFFSTTNEGQQSVKALAGQQAEIRMGLKLKTQ
ncbi:MAG: hypothetical protein R2825_30220 [Saprospiraceae bacterium]